MQTFHFTSGKFSDATLVFMTKLSNLKFNAKSGSSDKQSVAHFTVLRLPQQINARAKALTREELIIFTRIVCCVVLIAL